MLNNVNKKNSIGCVKQFRKHEIILLLFPVDRDTHKFFSRLQSNVFDALKFVSNRSRGTLKCTT